VLLRCLLVVMVLAAAPAFGQESWPRAAQVDQHALFRIVGRSYNVDPDLLEAIAAIESGGDSRAVSPAGAEGLMQLMPGTARRFRVTDPFDPVDNALGAVRYLDFLRRWEIVRPGLSASLPELLAAYNAGEGAIEKYRGVPPYAETQEYVRRVMLAYVLTGLIRRPPSLAEGRPVAGAMPQPGNSARGYDANSLAGRRVSVDVPPPTTRRPKALPVVDVFDQLAEIQRARALVLSNKPAGSENPH